MAAPILADYSYQFKDDGVLLNANSNSPVLGAPIFDIQKISGLDMATIRTSMKISEGEDGGAVEGEFLDPRTISIDGVLFCHTDESIESMLDRLKANYAPSKLNYPLYIKAPGVAQRVLFCKPLAVRYDIDQARRYNSTNFQVILQASDPVVYGSEVRSFYGILSNDVEGGHGFDHGYDLSMGGAPVAGSQLLFTNAGNKAVGAEFTLTGPVTGPRIVSDTTGKTLSMSTLVASSSMDKIIIDLHHRTVKLNGVSRRMSVDPSEGWFLIQPGLNSLRYQAISTTPVPIEGTFRDGYY